MKLLLWIAFGSALGGTGRHLLDLLAVEFAGDAFPVSTMLINISGSLLIGWLAGRWSNGGAATVTAARWHFWMTGVCGGYTTFSTFSWQVLKMIQDGHGQAAGFYAAASIGLGLFAAWIGMSLAIAKRRPDRVEEMADE